MQVDAFVTLEPDEPRARRLSVQAALYIPMILALAVCAIALVVALRLTA